MKIQAFCCIFIIFCLDVTAGFLPRYARHIHVKGNAGTNSERIRIGDITCREAWFEQVLDHFSWHNDTRWQQRYYVCQETEDNSITPSTPIFFYCGNEGNVEMYIKNTGLMFENAKLFSAILIFAEHRYYGKSLPFGSDFSAASLRYLSHEQALGDYAVILDDFKRKHKMSRSKVIAFGGSYGGMLSAWFRMKYPHIVEGAVAASAPVLAFHSSAQGPWRSEKYWQVVTRDASAEAGSDERCIPLMKQLWPTIDAMGGAQSGRDSLAAAFRLCQPLASAEQVKELKLYIAMAFDTMAMGNYPFPSDYLTGGLGELPPWPVREACKLVSSCGDCKATGLLDSVRAAISLLYNASGVEACLQLPQDTTYAGIWDFQWCTEMLPQESYFKRDGKDDMFYPFAMSSKDIDEHCMLKYGVTPRRGWIEQLYGGLTGIKRASNIVFSNGEFDPWAAGGVYASQVEDVASRGIEAVWIEEGAHHLDLFFSHPADPPSVRKARAVEIAYIRKWLHRKEAEGPEEEEILSGRVSTD